MCQHACVPQHDACWDAAQNNSCHEAVSKYLNKGWLPVGTHAFICDLSQCAATLCHTPTRGSCITQRLSRLLSTAFTVIPVTHNDSHNTNINAVQLMVQQQPDTKGYAVAAVVLRSLKQMISHMKEQWQLTITPV